MLLIGLSLLNQRTNTDQMRKLYTGKGWKGWEKAHPKPSKMCDPIPWNRAADEVGTAAGSRTALQAGVPLGSTREILRASWTPDDCSLRT